MTHSVALEVTRLFTLRDAREKMMGLGLNLTKFKLQSIKTIVDETLKRVDNVLTFVNGLTVTYSSKQVSPSFGCAPDVAKYQGILAAAQKMIDGLTYDAQDELTSGAPERASASFEDFTTAAFDPKYNATMAFLIYQKGKLVTEKYAPGETKDSVHMLGTAGGHSFASMFPAVRHMEGKLDLDELSHCPELSLLEKRARNMTARNLMSHRIGSPLQHPPSVGSARPVWDYDTEKMTWCVADKANYAAVVPSSYASGTVPTEYKVDHYLSAGTDSLLMRELRFTFSDNSNGLAEYAAYPWTDIFSKIGAKSFVVEADASGTFIGNHGVGATGQDTLKLVALMAQNGKWNGKQILPAEYIERNFNNPHGADKSFAEGWHAVSFPGLPKVFYMIAERGYVIACPELEFAIVDLQFGWFPKQVETILFVHFPAFLAKQAAAWATTTQIATTTTAAATTTAQ